MAGCLDHPRRVWPHREVIAPPPFPPSAVAVAWPVGCCPDPRLSPIFQTSGSCGAVRNEPRLPRSAIQWWFALSQIFGQPVAGEWERESAGDRLFFLWCVPFFFFLSSLFSLSLSLSLPIVVRDPFYFRKHTSLYGAKRDPSLPLSVPPTSAFASRQVFVFTCPF